MVVALERCISYLRGSARSTLSSHRIVCGLALLLGLYGLGSSTALGCVQIYDTPCPRMTPFLLFFDWNSDLVPPDRFDVVEQVVTWWKAGAQGRAKDDPGYP